MKPPELKGLNASFSILFYKHKHGINSEQVTAQCFVNENDIWVKHPRFYMWYTLKPEFEARLQASRNLNATKNLSEYMVTSRLGDTPAPESTTYQGSHVCKYAGAWLLIQNAVPLIRHKNVFVTRAILGTKLNFLFGRSASDYDVLWDDFFEHLCQNTREFLHIEE